MDNSNEPSSSNSENDQYYLPTYGFKYPTPLGSSEDSEPPSLFRPINFYNSREDQSDEEDMEIAHLGGGESEDSAYSSQSDPTDSNTVEVKLHKRSLWNAFMTAGNEMIVTKPGRSVFVFYLHCPVSTAKH